MVDFSNASEQNKIFLASNVRNPEALRKLAKESSQEILIEVIGNTITPTDVLEELTLSTNTKIQEMAQSQLVLRNEE